MQLASYLEGPLVVDDALHLPDNQTPADGDDDDDDDDLI